MRESCPGQQVRGKGEGAGRRMFLISHNEEGKKQSRRRVGDGKLEREIQGKQPGYTIGGIERMLEMKAPEPENSLGKVQVQAAGVFSVGITPPSNGKREQSAATVPNVSRPHETCPMFISGERKTDAQH